MHGCIDFGVKLVKVFEWHEKSGMRRVVNR